MEKTCQQRVEAIEHIDKYRAIVAAIAGAYGSIHGAANGAIMANRHFPDPILYGARVEGSPSKIAKNAERLGPNPGDDRVSMAAQYEGSIKRQLDSALAELDRHWEGSAADTFLTEYMAELRKHLQNLADACAAQKVAADNIELRVKQGHDEVVGAITEMVGEIVTMATLGSVGEGLGVAGGAIASAAGTVSVSTLGAGAILLTAAMAAAITARLVVHHGNIRSKIDSLNTALSVERTNELEAIVRQKLQQTVGRRVSRVGWNPQTAT